MRDERKNGQKGRREEGRKEMLPKDYSTELRCVIGELFLVRGRQEMQIMLI